MKRLRLNVDDLRVESFAAKDSADVIRGTVEAHGKATQETCGCTEEWDTCQTDYASCEYTCDALTVCHAFSQCIGWCNTSAGPA